MRIYRQNKPLLLILGSLALVTLLLIILVLTAKDSIGLFRPQFSGFRNYLRLFLKDKISFIALRNTLMLGLLPVFCALAFAFPAAKLLYRQKPLIQNIVTGIFFALSVVIGVFIFLLSLSGDLYGVINSILLKLSIIKEPLHVTTDLKRITGFFMIVDEIILFGLFLFAFILGSRLKSKHPDISSLLPYGSLVLGVLVSFKISGMTTLFIGFPASEYAAHVITSHLLDYVRPSLQIVSVFYLLLQLVVALLCCLLLWNILFLFRLIKNKIKVKQSTELSSKAE